MLSSTSPLLQQWFSQAHPGVSPFRLYALSNAGSLLALVTFPVYFETHFTRTILARLWGWGLLAYAVSCGFCAVKTGLPPVYDQDEPRRVAAAIRKLNLRYAVITSVDRDDLEDGGAVDAAHFGCGDGALFDHAGVMRPTGSRPIFTRCNNYLHRVNIIVARWEGKSRGRWGPLRIRATAARALRI